MTVEEVNIVEMHTLQALVETGHEVLSRAPVAIRSWPHIIARFAADEKFVAIWTEVIIHESSHRFLSTAIRRAVVVGQIEMCDAIVEGIVRDGTASLVWVNATKVVPESQTQRPSSSYRCSEATYLSLQSILFNHATPSTIANEVQTKFRLRCHILFQTLVIDGNTMRITSILEVCEMAVLAEEI